MRWHVTLALDFYEPAKCKCEAAVKENVLELVDASSPRAHRFNR
jgi:hypothetical protein